MYKYIHIYILMVLEIYERNTFKDLVFIYQIIYVKFDKRIFDKCGFICVDLV